MADEQPRRFQFTLRRLLILSTALSVVFAVAGLIAGPLVVKAVLGGYLGILTGWFVIRWPAVRENWRTSQRARLAAIRAKRESAIASARAKQAAQANGSDWDGPPRKGRSE